MSDPAARTLRLLSLLQTQRHWPATELGRRLGVSTRTIRRDVDRLRDLGYPVAALAGVAGGYRLEAGSVLPPLLLDDEEAVAIAVGLRTAAGQAVTGIEEASVRALAKLEHLLPSRLRRRVSAVHDYTVALPSSSRTVDAELLARISLACRDRERLRFCYQAHDGTTSRRLAEPHRLVAAGRRWYLLAWDVDRADWRTFRVDRVEEAQPTGVLFREREIPGGDAAAYVAEAIQAPFARHRAVVRLHAPIDRIADRLAPWAGVLEPDGSDACLLRTVTDSLEWLTVYIAVLGVDFDVLEPAELRDEMRAIGQRLARASS